MLLPIGKFTTTAGTPKRLTSTQSDPTAPFPCHGVLIQVLSTNAGKVYVGDSSLNKSAMSGVHATLPVPTANSLPSFTAALTLATLDERFRQSLPALMTTAEASPCVAS